MSAVVRRRGRSQKAITIIEAAERILYEIAPASVRAVCYRLFVEGQWGKLMQASICPVSP